MGEQVGLLFMTGQFGHVQLSIDADGKPIAKFSRPISGKKIKRGANYVLTRKNNDEFSGAAFAAKSLRNCMGEQVRQFSDRHLTSRWMGLTRRVISKGPGMGGQRSFEVMPNSVDFRGLELNKEESLGSRLQAHFSLAVNPDRNTATLDLPAFAPRNYISNPSGATHYRVMLVVGVLSDFLYTGDSTVYAAVNPDLDGLSATSYSAVLPVQVATTAPLQLVASISGLPVLPATAGLLVSVGIEFYRVVNGFEDLFAQGNAMRVLGAF